MVKEQFHVGQRVRLAYDIETRGGRKFKQGQIMRVDSVTPKYLALSCKNDITQIFGPKRIHVHHVRYFKVEPVEENKS